MSLFSANTIKIKKEKVSFEQFVRKTITAVWLEIQQMSFKGTQESVAYDTAWVGAIKSGQNNPYFPEAIEWLLKNQEIDGSWKGSTSTPSFICDQMLSTIASVGTLASFEKYERSLYVQKGLRWISNNLHLINSNNPEFIQSVGFELLFPSLLMRLDRIVTLDFDVMSYFKMQQDKLSKLSLSHIITGKTPLLFSIEFLDALSDKDTNINLDYQISNNGSLACSPASTAWYASKSPKSLPSLLYYIESIRQKDNGWPHFSDSTLFTLSYSLYIIQRSLGYLPNYLKPFAEHLYKNWTPLGVGFSTHFPVPDFDDTILALNVLSKGNLLKEKDLKRFWNILEFYKEKDHFKSYPFEKDPSILVNLHALDTIKDKVFAKEYVEDLLGFFKMNLMQNNSFGKDKYHYSAFLQNARGIIAFSDIANELSQSCLNWFYENLGSDGSWPKLMEPNIEEIAYTVMALSFYSLYIEKIDLEILKPSVTYLIEHIFDSFEPLWISKVLYSPYEIQKSNLFAALILYYKALGNDIQL